MRAIAVFLGLLISASGALAEEAVPQLRFSEVKAQKKDQPVKGCLVGVIEGFQIVSTPGLNGCEKTDK